MSMFPDNQARRVELDYGTTDRSMFNFFNAVYAWMAVGLAVTGVTAYLVAGVPAAAHFFQGGRGFAIFMLLALMGLSFAIQGAAMRISAGAGLALFILYAALMGGLMSWVLVFYKIQTIGAAFLVTGGTFAACTVYGMVTKRNLSVIGRVLVMALFGLIIASVVNFFVASSPLSRFITYAVLGVSIGITAYETQMLKNLAQEHVGNPNMLGRIAVIGSLVLYISFMNMFMSILRIMGDRR